MVLSKRTKELLKKGEDENIEYKVSITQDFNDILVSFANEEGGICLFGVEDDRDEDGKHIGRIVSIEISDRTRGQIQSRADQTNDPIKIKIESEHDNECRGVYIVTVFEGEKKPYSTGGGRYLIRHNGQNCPITPTMMEGAIEHRINTSPTAQPIIRIAPEEISIHPSIKIDKKPFEINKYLKEEERYAIKIPIKLANIGNIPAQNVIVDAEIHFAKRRPCNSDSLPIHLYQFIDFLPPISILKEMNGGNYHVIFDNFIAKEIILDFFENRKKFKG
ncbi:MAG: AlbA family DNA-binding domain-containing protein, partial [Candidatus Heimdallarchaeaceae archaeon]